MFPYYLCVIVCVLVSFVCLDDGCNFFFCLCVCFTVGRFVRSIGCTLLDIVSFLTRALGNRE